MDEFSTNASELWVLKDDLCRCCHAEGAFESFGVLINDLGESTEFSNMLEFIGIKIKPMQGYLGRATSKICSACMALLRSASNFKEQVMSCEISFQMLCEKNLIKVPDDNEVKLEKLESDDDNGAISDSPESAPGDEIKNEIKIEDTYEEITIRKPPTRRQGGKLAAKPKGLVQAEIQTETDHSAKKIHVRKIKEGNNKRQCLRILKLGKYETVKKTAEKPKKSDVTSETRAKKKYKRPRKAGNPSKKKKYIGSWTSAVIEENGLYRCNANAESCNKRVSAKCEQVQHKNKEVILKHLVRTHYRLRCTECPERFRTKQALNRHLLAEHNFDKIIQFSCGSCDKVFNTKQQYENHLQSYHKLGVLRKCDKCDYETYLECSMRKHVLKHMDVKPFSCRFCKKTFKRTSTRTFHERIHTREGLKKCPYCEQSFVQRSSVKYHVLKHHPGERI